MILIPYPGAPTLHSVYLVICSTICDAVEPNERIQHFNQLFPSVREALLNIYGAVDPYVSFSITHILYYYLKPPPLELLQGSCGSVAPTG